MTKIALGGDVTLDLGVLVESRMLVQGNSGAGKTTILRRLLEQTHPHIQQIVIDPEGEFYTLREQFDYIIAGKGGDCAADPLPARAKLLARRVMELGCSIICDISELSAQPGNHERNRFVRHFLQALIETPRTLQRDVLVVIDEAHLFCPQDAKGEAAAAVIDLCTRGRKRGLCAILATQRLSKLHKDAAAELRNVLIGATGLDIDQVRAGDVLGMGKPERMRLRDLKWGQFHGFGPAFSFNGVQLVRAGDTATKNPPKGRGIAAPAQPTPKMRALLAKVADLPAEADQEARDVEGLRRELADARRKLTLAEKQMTEAVRREIVPKPCDHEREIAALTQRLIAANDAVEANRVAFLTLHAAVKDGVGILTRALGGDAPQLDTARSFEPKPKTVAPPASARHAAMPKPSANGRAPTGDLEGITGGAMRMLQRLAERYPETWTRAQLATLARVKKSGGTFGTYFSRLTQRGLIVEVAGRVSITETGLDLMGGPPAQPQSHDELIESWRDRLTGGARRMLDALLDAGPDGLAREELAERANITLSGGTFGTYMSRLMTNGLVEKRGDLVVATDLLLGVPA